MKRRDHEWPRMFENQAIHGDELVWSLETVWYCRSNQFLFSPFISGYFLHDFFDMLVYDARDSIDLLIHHIVVQLLMISVIIFQVIFCWLNNTVSWLSGPDGLLSPGSYLPTIIIICFVLFRAKLLVLAFGSKGMVLRLEHSPPTIVRAAHNNGQQLAI